MSKMYLIKPNGTLGFSTVESSNMTNEHRKEYEAEGFRVVNELEYLIARMVTRHNARQIIRIAQSLAREMGEEIDE
jgi:hypothetical protein